MVVKGQGKCEDSLGHSKGNASKLHSKNKGNPNIYQQYSSVTSSVVGANDVDVQVRLGIYLGAYKYGTLGWYFRRSSY